MGRTLTAKQKAFADEYLIDLNATQAAIRAGYSAKTAEWIGPQLLGKSHVADEIARKMKDRERRTGITQDYVLNTVKETVDRCRQFEPVLDQFGKQVFVETPNGGKRSAAFLFDAKNVLRGCELLGKHLGMFASKLELTGKDGGPVEVKVVPDSIMEMIRGGGDE